MAFPNLVTADDEMDVGAMLETLGRELGIRRLLLEGGGRTNGQFFRAELVDEVSLLVAPAIDGGDDVGGASMPGLRSAKRPGCRCLEPKRWSTASSTCVTG